MKRPPMNVKKAFKKPWEGADVAVYRCNSAESGGVNQGHILRSPAYSILKESALLTGDLLVFLLRERKGGSEGESGWARWTSDLYLAEVDRWKASENGQMVTWYGSEVGCLMVYGFWPNIHSFWDVFFMLFQAVKCLEYKALPFRGSAWVMACWEATRGHTGHHRTFYSFLEKRFFSFLK